MENKFISDKVLNPKLLISKSEIFSNNSLIPQESGIYGAYFKEVPLEVDVDSCVSFGEYTLLYIGVSNNLKKRLEGHYIQDASRSTLRKTLGLLLVDESSFPLRKIKPYKRLTRNFTPDGERWLSAWIEKNMYFSFEVTPDYLLIEDKYLKNLGPQGVLPLNIKGNSHPYANKLKKVREAAIISADENVFYKT